MAGGATTVPLALAVASAGGLPFLAGGYKTPEALATEVDALISSGYPFGVNLFVPGDESLDEQAFRSYADSLESEAQNYGVELDPVPVRDDDRWDEKLALMMEREVPVVSLTFGLPEPEAISALQRSGSSVLATVTTPEEAGQAGAAGADGLVVQGARAGGHSATFEAARDPGSGTTVDLLRAIEPATRLPVVAGGGVDGPEAVAALLQAGAQAVVVGTLLLRTEESGASQVHKDALADPAFEETVITRAFTGRPARGLRNGFIDRHEADAPLGYPAIHHLTRGIRSAAVKRGDPDAVHLWAGTGFRNATVEPAGEVVRRLSTGGWLS